MPDPSFESLRDAWYELTDDVKAFVGRLFDAAHLPMTENRLADPKVVALALLCRSIGHFEAALRLLPDGFVVEARTLIRSCIEDAGWIEGIRTMGLQFVTKHIVEDAYRSKMVRGRRLLEWLKETEHDPAMQARLQAFLDETQKSFPKPHKVNLRDLFGTGPLKDLYVFYGELSGDAAHPSADSISRHLADDESAGLTLICEPEPDQDEILSTIEHGVMTLLVTLAAVNEILGNSASPPKLTVLSERYRVLQRANYKRAP